METDPPRPDSPLEVEISDTQSHLEVDRPRLVGLIRRTLALQGVASASISVALVDDATIRAINARHLGHDWATDVISFGLSESGEPGLAGELVVSAEMARATALSVGADPFAELSLYVVHGLLHLCGYDDGSAEDAASIRVREAEVLADLGLAYTFHLVDGPGRGSGEAEAGPASVLSPGGPGRESARWTR